LNERCALRCEDAGLNLHPVIQAGVGKDFEAGANGTPFRVIAAIDEALDASLNHSASAHGAGFDGDIQNCLREPIIVDHAGRFA